VELTVYDDQSNPSVAVRLYRRLIYQDKVDLLIGPYSDTVIGAVIPVIEEAKMPTPTGVASLDVWRARQHRWTVMMPPPANLFLAGVPDLVVPRGARTVAIVHADVGFPLAVATGFEERCRMAGMQVIFKEAYPQDITDYTPLVSKAKTTNPDVFGIGGYFADAIALVKAAKAVNFNPRLFVFVVGVALPDFGRSLGGDANYVVGNTLWEPTYKTRRNTQFVNGYREKYGVDVESYHAAFGYATCQLLEETVKAVRGLDRERMRNYLFTARTETVIGKYKVDENGAQIGMAGNPLIQWQGGRKEVIWPEVFKTSSMLYPTPPWGAR